MFAKVCGIATGRNVSGVGDDPIAAMVGCRCHAHDGASVRKRRSLET